MTAVDSKAENDSQENEHDGNHGNRRIGGTGSYIKNTVFISSTESGSNDSGKCGYDQNQCQIRENNK